MTMTKKLLFTAFITSLLTLSIAHAQENESPLPMQEGSKALQFQISDNFNLSSFSGALFSYKRHLSEDKAYRIGVSLISQYTMNNFPDSDIDQDDTLLNFGLGVEYTRMHYTDPDAEIKFYYGYGPGINVGLNRIVRDQGNTTYTNRDALFGISGIGYAGVEWFFHSSMSLHAEYRGSIQLNHRRAKQSREEEFSEEANRNNRTTVTLGGDGVRFGLSVYF